VVSIIQDKNQVGVPIDRRVNLGKPMSSKEVAEKSSIYRVDNVAFRTDKEVIEYVQRVWELRTKWASSQRRKRLRLMAETNNKCLNSQLKSYMVWHSTHHLKDKRNLN